MPKFLEIFFFHKLRASRHQGVNRHLNYIGTPRHPHPLPISYNNIYKEEKNMYKMEGLDLTPRK
jgi:hypothetical protein